MQMTVEIKRLIFWAGLFGALLLAVTIAMGGTARANENPKSRVNFYIQKYGRIDPASYPLAQRAKEIFSRVLAVADKRGTRPPHLRIVNSQSDPWAIALPDGFIVLSNGTIDLCYQGVSQQEGDARLAFVFGHELGHLAEDDFWHLETYLALAGDPEHAALKSILEGSSDVPGATAKQRLAIARGKELKADDRGFLYSAIAGFRVDTLVGDGAGRDDFFNYWVKQIPHASNDPSHPQAEDRAKFLQTRLRGLLEKVEMFRFGVRLAHFQRYEDAVYFFREFQKTFPARETFNNLGYCYLKMAIKAMDPTAAHHYWLPSVLDGSSRAETLALRGGTPNLSEQARELLQEAATCFKQANEADPSYLPSQVNLAVTDLYLGEIYQARAAVEAARRLAPKDAEVQGLRALIICREDPLVDMWPQTMQMLQRLIDTPGAPLSIHYNRAVLLEERGRSGEAQLAWNDLAQMADKLPEPFRSKVVHSATLPIPPLDGDTGADIKPSWTLPVQIGEDLLENTAAQQTLAGWDKLDFTWPQEQLIGHLYRDGAGTALLEIDDFVEMVVIPAPAASTVATLDAAAGGRLQQSNIAGGTLYNCLNRWSALVRDGQVIEIWIVKN